MSRSLGLTATGLHVTISRLDGYRTSCHDLSALRLQDFMLQSLSFTATGLHVTISRLDGYRTSCHDLSVLRLQDSCQDLSAWWLQDFMLQSLGMTATGFMSGSLGLMATGLHVTISRHDSYRIHVRISRLDGYRIHVTISRLDGYRTSCHDLSAWRLQDFMLRYLGLTATGLHIIICLTPGLTALCHHLSHVDYNFYFQRRPTVGECQWIWAIRRILCDVIWAMSEYIMWRHLSNERRQYVTSSGQSVRTLCDVISAISEDVVWRNLSNQWGHCVTSSRQSVTILCYAMTSPDAIFSGQKHLEISFLGDCQLVHVMMPIIGHAVHLIFLTLRGLYNCIIHSLPTN